MAIYHRSKPRMKKAGYEKGTIQVCLPPFMLPQDCIPFLIYFSSLLLPVTLPVLAKMQNPQKQLRHHSPETRPHAGNSVVLLGI